MSVAVPLIRHTHLWRAEEKLKTKLSACTMKTYKASAGVK